MFQMCAEFLRLTNVNAVDTLQDLLEKYGKALVSATSEERKLPLPALLAAMLGELDAAKNEESRRGWFLPISLLVCFSFYNSC